MTENLTLEQVQEDTEQASDPVAPVLNAPIKPRKSWSRRVIQSVIGDRRYQRIRYAVEGRQLRKLVEAHSPHGLDDVRKREAVQFWRQFGVRLNASWHRFYSALNPDVDPLLFIPEDIFAAHIEPSLNRMDLAVAYADKNSYGMRFPDARIPSVLIRRMHGRYFDESYNALSTSAVMSLLKSTRGAFMIKPAQGTGGGLMVQELEISAGALRLGQHRVAWEQLSKAYGPNYLIQSRQCQHERLAAFHPSSLNTLRVITLRTEQDVLVCACVLRVGSGGHCTDNVSAGGMGCGVHPGGFLRESALDRRFQRFKAHPVSHKQFCGFEIPGWYEVCALVKKLHLRLPYFDLASWDIAIDPDSQPVLIEVNLQYQEVNGPQCLNGPLFGQHTVDVLTKVFGPPRSK